MPWICDDCGTKLGKRKEGAETYHEGKCDYCGRWTVICSWRRYGYPPRYDEVFWEGIKALFDE